MEVLLRSVDLHLEVWSYDLFSNTLILTISSRIRSYGKRFEVGQTGVFLLSILLSILLQMPFYFSISLRLGSHNEPNSLDDTCHSMETLWPRSRVHITLFDVPPTQTFWMKTIFTMSHLLMLNASKNTTKLRSNMWSVYDKSLKISSWSWDLRLLLDVRNRIYQMFKSIIELPLIISCCGDSGWGYHWCRFRTKGLLQR